MAMGVRSGESRPLASAQSSQFPSQPAPAASSHLNVSAASSATAGSAVSVTVTALDPFGNIATGYRGTVHFTSSDAQAVLPADYPFTASDNGVHSFNMTLMKAGVQTVIV